MQAGDGLNSFVSVLSLPLGLKPRHTSRQFAEAEAVLTGAYFVGGRSFHMRLGFLIRGRSEKARLVRP